MARSQPLRRLGWRQTGRALMAGVILCSAAACARPSPISLSGHFSIGDPALLPTLEAYAQAPIVGGNQVQLLFNGDEILPAMLAAIRAARRTITYSQFAYLAGTDAQTVTDALAERCHAGVAVKLLVDGVGSFNMPPEYRRRLLDTGCDLAVFRPLRLLALERAPNRNHRRILVVDGRIAITGGAGLGTQWMGDGLTAGHWRDTDVQVEGPIVTYLQGAFAESWLHATGEVLAGEGFFPVLAPAGRVRAQVLRSAPEAGNYALHTTLLLAVAASRHSIEITDPYFIPDAQMIQALIQAAQRGVRVAVLVPGLIDYSIVLPAERRVFGPLLRAGAEIWRYGPALLHAKTMVIDGYWSTVGSANLDNESLALNEELNLVLYDREVAARLEASFSDDLRYATPLTYQAWRHRSFWKRLFETLIVPLQGLM